MRAKFRSKNTTILLINPYIHQIYASVTFSVSETRSGASRYSFCLDGSHKTKLAEGAEGH